MFSRVVQHIDQRITHRPRGRENTGVIAVTKDASFASPQSIHGASNPYEQTLHAPAESFAVVRFDDEVEVIALNREVDEAKTESVRTCPKRSFEDPEN